MPLFLGESCSVLIHPRFALFGHPVKDDELDRPGIGVRVECDGDLSFAD